MQLRCRSVYHARARTGVHKIGEAPAYRHELLYVLVEELVDFRNAGLGHVDHVVRSKPDICCGIVSVNDSGVSGREELRHVVGATADDKYLMRIAAYFMPSGTGDCLRQREWRPDIDELPGVVHLTADINPSGRERFDLHCNPRIP